MVGRWHLICAGTGAGGSCDERTGPEVADKRPLSPLPKQEIAMPAFKGRELPPYALSVGAPAWPLLIC